MKTCPHCGGELRPSVIKCVHCGSRLDEPQPARVPAGARATGAPIPAGGPSVSGAPAPSAAAAGAPVHPGTRDRTPAPPPSVFDPPKPASADPWATPSERSATTDAAQPIAPAPVVTARSPRRVDLALVPAGALALAAAAVAATSLSLPWVTATLSTTGPRGKLREVAALPFFADDAIARHLVLGVAVVVGLLGLLWFWYGLDRGVQLPVFAHPGLAALAGVVGWGTVGLTRLGAFFWQSGFVAHAREAGLTKEAMRALLDDHETRVMAFSAEAGTGRFALAASLALLAGLLAWWSQRERAI